MEKTEKKQKLVGKDLVTIGIYTAIYFIVIMAVAFLGFIPVFIPLLSVLVPLIGGIPFMLFLSKTKKFGMITIFSTLNGLLMFLTGMGIYAVFTGLIFGFIADMIVKSGNYKSVSKSLWGYSVFSIWLFGNFMPFYIGRQSQFEMLTQGYGKEYANALETLMPIWLAPVLLICCFVFGAIGGFLGKKICKKHFERAGIVS